ncbi:MAG: glutamate--tRNA ligase [bacterium]|nr:glutamate--tRNA ligase [bacterium]
MSSSPRVRIAPSPTGTVHLGLARTSLFNWAYARGRGGKFLLRIEDTDRERSTVESERAILEGLAWLGLDWDEGPDVGGPHAPYHQSQRIDRHRAVAARLLEEGKAYRCFCKPEELAAMREEQMAGKRKLAYDGRFRDLDPTEAERRAEGGEAFTLRFRVPEGETRIADLARGEVVFDHAEVEDWVMVRQDGNPTYNFVVVCDDADMEITHVLRGEEHLVNTPKQLLLYIALGLEAPSFGHLPLMLGKDKKKLSKRSGDVSLDDYRNQGYPRLAILNFLALQGWALDGEHDLFTLEELVEKFDVADVAKAGAVFDIDKFQWMAGEYLRQETPAELAAHCAPFVASAGLMTADELEERGDWFVEVVRGEQERIRLYSELPGRIEHYFGPDDEVAYDPKAEKGARKREGRVETLLAYLEWLKGRTDLAEPAALGEATKTWIEERGAKIPELFQPLRCALTGMGGGRDLFEIIALLGAERTFARIEHGARRLG